VSIRNIIAIALVAPVIWAIARLIRDRSVWRRIATILGDGDINSRIAAAVLITAGLAMTFVAGLVAE